MHSFLHRIENFRAHNIRISCMRTDAGLIVDSDGIKECAASRFEERFRGRGLDKLQLPLFPFNNFSSDQRLVF